MNKRRLTYIVLSVVMCISLVAHADTQMNEISSKRKMNATYGNIENANNYGINGMNNY